MGSPSMPSPQSPERRGFHLLAKNFGSSSSDGKNDRSTKTLAYQPRLKKSTATGNGYSNGGAADELSELHQYPRSDDLSPSTPRASTSKLTSSSRNSMEQKQTPNRIRIEDSARDIQHHPANQLQSQNAVHRTHFPHRRPSGSAISEENTPRALTHKRRQASQGADGMLRNGNVRKPSWGSDQSRSPRQGLRRTLSSPLDHQTATHKEPIAGAKPVAPSFHPNAPRELKVKPPSNAVLLPFLSIPGMGKDSDSQPTSTSMSPTSPPDFNAEDVLKSSSIKHQRPGIKVRIVTWNQGSSVPKGNLEVLLGRVGEYIAPEAGWDESSDEEGETRKHRGMGVAGQEKVPRKERIPPLPHDDAHPYHIVVVAGQECPWGDGKRIATGVGLAGELGDLARSKSRAAHLAKDKNKETVGVKEKKEVVKEEKVMNTEDKLLPPTLSVEGEFPFSEASNKSFPSTPLVSVPPTPGGAAAGMVGWGIGGKGWSDMCEDWLCRGPLAQATATKGLAQASKAVSPSPLLSPVATPEDGMSPSGSRSHTPNALQVNRSESLPLINIPPLNFSEPEKVSTPSLSSNVISQDFHYASASKSTSLAVPKPRNLARRISLRNNRSKEALEVKLPLEEYEEEEIDLTSSSPSSRPLSPLKQTIDSDIRLPAQQQKHLPGKPHHRLGLHIPGLSAPHHVTVQSDGTPLSLGAYELVAKERCYMMYMAVYVWRGCLDRVVKISQGHVKSGLLAGRVGNKGAVGISLKLGSSRLLFVNAHLAAHEGKLAERVANVEKIKKELKVDTYLPPEDPRNQADDVTEAFDYAFWFGDLNFRVDISRQHADWLLMKKQYQDALAFDQLSKVMKEQPLVFKGFFEAPITFPPTFKYDVLKTIKQKREEKARKQKAASIALKANDSDNYSLEASKSNAWPASTSLQGLTSQSPRVLSNEFNGTESLKERRRKEENVDDDASSISSSAWGDSGLSTMAGNQSDREDLQMSSSIKGAGDSSIASHSIDLDPVVSSNTAAAEGHKIHGKVIKVKKRFLDVVHALGSHSQRGAEDEVPSVVKTGRKMKEDQRQQDEKEMIAEIKAQSIHKRESWNSVASGHVRSESYTNLEDVRPSIRIPNIRRRSSAGDLSEASPTSGEDYVLQPSSSIAAMTEEYERQPYDTSAKQRVPSWCDRVLWKSNIQVEEEKANEMNESGSHGLHSRMSHAISHAIHGHRRNYPSHHKLDVGPSVTFANQGAFHSRNSKPVESPTRDLLTPPLISGEPSPSPRRRWFHRKNSGSEMKRAFTLDPHDLEGISSKKEKGGKRAMSAIDLPQTLNRSSSSRSTSANYKKPTPLPRRSSLEVPRRRVQSGSPLAFAEDRDRLDEHARRVPAVAARRSDSPRQHLYNHSSVSPKFSPAIRSAPVQDTANRRTSWWNDLVGSHLPSFLTPQGAMSALSNLSSSRNETNGLEAQQEEEGEEEELIGPRKGQIECLSYKSLDDREMRLLEGRSDHRPVIWVGNVGI